MAVLTDQPQSLQPPAPLALTWAARQRRPQATMAAVERVELGDDGFTISKLVTGLWQIADMEKDGEEVDLGPAAAAMREYAEAGQDTFDMADHCALPAAGHLLPYLPHPPP